MSNIHFGQCDFHTHTELCGEAQAKGFTIEKLFETADALNMRYVGYSEHWHVGTSPDLFRRIRDEVERLQPRFCTTVFISAEIDVLNSTGDLACDPAEAEQLLDYVSVAISHHQCRGAEQLRPDMVDDTVAMIEAVCRLPAVTMLMHPQIVYGRNVEHIDREVGLDVYRDVMQTIRSSGKVIDYPSVGMSMDYLADLGFDAERRRLAKASFVNFTRAAIETQVPLAPGSDAHHVLWHDGVTRWFGNNTSSLELLSEHGYTGEQLWHFEER